MLEKIVNTAELSPKQQGFALGHRRLHHQSTGQGIDQVHAGIGTLFKTLVYFSSESVDHWSLLFEGLAKTNYRRFLFSC